MNANWEISSRLALRRSVIASADIFTCKSDYQPILNMADPKVDETDAAVF